MIDTLFSLAFFVSLVAYFICGAIVFRRLNGTKPEPIKAFAKAAAYSGIAVCTLSLLQIVGIAGLDIDWLSSIEPSAGRAFLILPVMVAGTALNGILMAYAKADHLAKQQASATPGHVPAPQTP